MSKTINNSEEVAKQKVLKEIERLKNDFYSLNNEHVALECDYYSIIRDSDSDIFILVRISDEEELYFLSTDDIATFIGMNGSWINR